METTTQETNTLTGSSPLEDVSNHCDELHQVVVNAADEHDDQRLYVVARSLAELSEDLRELDEDLSGLANS